MTKQIGEVYFTGGNIIKIEAVNGNAFNAVTWVKSKKVFTKKSSLYGFNGHDHWQKLTEHDIANLSK